MEARGRVSTFRRIPVANDGSAIDVLRSRHWRFAFAPHAHAEFAFGLAEAGEHRLIVHGRDLRVVAGDVVVLPPETIHAVESSGGTPWQYTMLHVPPALVRGVLGVAPDVLLGVAHGSFVTRHPRIAGMLHRLLSAVLSAESCATERVELLRVVAGTCLERAREVPSPCIDAAVTRLIAILNDSPRRAPCLGAVARESGLSVYQLIRRFRSVVGAPPIVYHTQLRARHARELLGETCSIGNVAHRSGYADQSHLNRQFKRVFGVTPGQYRRAIRALGA
jgi:AraC family chemosensory pili system transcriptional regulator ChpD